MEDIQSVFEVAQAYVMLSRVKELNQLYILKELSENKIYPIPKAFEEIRRLHEVSVNQIPSPWEKETTTGEFKVSYLNVRSLINKFENIRSDLSLQQSDVII